MVGVWLEWGSARRGGRGSERAEEMLGWLLLRAAPGGALVVMMVGRVARRAGWSDSFSGRW